MAGISPRMETPSMGTEQRTLADSVAILGEVNPPIVQGIPMRITTSPIIVMTGLVSDGEQATLSLRHMILLTHGHDAISWQRGCLSHLIPGNKATYLTQNWIWLRDLSNLAVGCHLPEKTICTLMPATLTVLQILTCLDGTWRTRARLTITDRATLTKGAGVLHFLWMIRQTGLASDLLVPHLVLVGDRTAGTCHMKGPSVVRLVPRAFHLRNTLVLAPLAGRLLRRHLPFAPPESGQNLHHGLATVLHPQCGHLLVLIRSLQTLLCDRLCSEAIL